MKSRAERLDEILTAVQADACFTVLDNPSSFLFKAKKLTKQEAVSELIALLKECVPGEDLDDDYEPGDYYRSGWNECREETLKNIKEMGK